MPVQGVAVLDVAPVSHEEDPKSLAGSGAPTRPLWAGECSSTVFVVNGPKAKAIGSARGRRIASCAGERKGRG